MHPVRSRTSHLLRWASALGFTALHGGVFAFNCGPNALTYAVTDINNVTTGFRCVVYTYHGLSHGAPDFEFTWYGEGRKGGQSYRHIGAACATAEVCNPPHARAIYISGNGESLTGQALGLRPIVTEASAAPATIRLEGDWNETWRRVSNLSFVPMPPPTTCGPALDTYEVRARNANGPGPVAGLRCVERSSSQFVWYGVGQWPNQGTYAHLGFGTSYVAGGATRRTGGAADLCDGSIGQACSRYPFSTLQLAASTYYQGFEVTGSWNEWWLRPGSYPPPVVPEPPPPRVCERRPYLPQCQR
jgi:hypothetical protein